VRRPLFGITRRDTKLPSLTETLALEGVELSETPADKRVFDVLSRQYAIPTRFPMGYEAEMHPSGDPFNQEDDQIDRQYKIQGGAEWNITRPFSTVNRKAFLSLEGVHMASDTAPFLDDYNAQLTQIEKRTAAVVWSQSGKCVTIVGYIAADDNRDFFDVVTRALEVYMATGRHVQPCSIAIDPDICSPSYPIQDIAGDGEDSP